jgi:hypothetical protein
MNHDDVNRGRAVQRASVNMPPQNGFCLKEMKAALRTWNVSLLSSFWEELTSAWSRDVCSHVPFHSSSIPFLNQLEILLPLRMRSSSQ